MIVIMVLVMIPYQWLRRLSESRPERDPQFELRARKLELRRHHTDDRVAAAAKVHASPEDILITAESLLPQIVTQHHQRLTVFCL